MGVELTATAVHPDTVVHTQLIGNAYRYGIADIEELPKLSWLPMPMSGRGMPSAWLPMPTRGRGMPSILPVTAEPVDDVEELRGDCSE